jgi:hypothetical protein
MPTFRDVELISTSGNCLFLGSSLVSWSSRKQSSVAQSTAEAEYVIIASCCSQLLWITYTLSDFGEELLKVDFCTPSYEFTINICMYLIF